jgi:hypothetical protein
MKEANVISHPAMARLHAYPTLLIAAVLGLAAVASPAAKAGCGDYQGLIQVCFKGSCEVQKLVRHCSSAMGGSQWISDQGYQFSYSRPIGNRWTLMEVIYEPYTQTLYSGDPDKSPYKFDICGEDRNVGGPCSQKGWAKGYK